MADKREAYAGDLTSDVIGKRIRIRTVFGEPTVDAVQHYLATGDERRTLIDFASGATTSVPDTELVEVLPERLTVRGAHLCPVCSATFNTAGQRDGHMVSHREPAGGDAA